MAHILRGWIISRCSGRLPRFLAGAELWMLPEGSRAFFLFCQLQGILIVWSNAYAIVVVVVVVVIVVKVGVGGVGGVVGGGGGGGGGGGSGEC